MSVNNENNRLKIEDELTAALNGDRLHNALDFIAFMKDNGMTTHAEHHSAFEYNGEWVCIVCIIPIDGEPGWVIFDNPLTSKFDDFVADEDLKKFAWEHVNICTSCGGSAGCGSQPGRTKMIFGKEFENVCTSETAFWNSDADALGKIKRMIGIWKESKDCK
jgi:hypothetical protein